MLFYIAMNISHLRNAFGEHVYVSPLTVFDRFRVYLITRVVEVNRANINFFTVSLDSLQAPFTSFTASSQ